MLGEWGEKDGATGTAGVEMSRTQSHPVVLSQTWSNQFDWFDEESRKVPDLIVI